MTLQQSVLPLTGHAWSEQEKGVLVRAASQAHACGLAEPWSLRVAGDRLEIAERLPAALRGHTSTSRHGILACGCALAVVVSALRVLGWWPEVVLFGDRDRAELVATVSANRRHRPSVADVAAYRAVFSRRRQRHGTLDPGDPEAVPPGLLDVLLRAGSGGEARVRPVSAIPAAHRKRGLDAGLLVVTATDGRRGRLLAGVALQRAWLAVSAAGLTAVPLIDPFENREFRQRVVRHAKVDGSPQSLLVLGR